MNKVLKKLAVVGFLLLLGFLVLVKPRLKSTTTPILNLPKLDLKKVQTVKVIRGDLEKDLTLAGKVDAGSYALLQFQTSGRLSWVGVKEGDEVKKWQAIASLDKQDLEKQLKKIMNDYLTNRWNFEDTQDQYRTTKENFLLTDEIKMSEAKNVLFLPVEAINEKDNEKFVYQKDQKGKITQKTIKTGLETDEFVEIKEGLEEESLVYYSS